MKPLNLDNKPCSPVSSNCVVWQGPDIECIELCHGDSVSDVMHKLATELCTIMTQLKVSSYDLTCLGITSACPPKDFTALVQFLIARICELEKIDHTHETTSSTSGSTSGCPDCVVTVAECFVVGTTTTMQLSDYVQAIATKVCALVDQISVIQTQITNLDLRVTTLENASPQSFTLPSIATDCLQSVIAGNPASTTIDIVLSALLSDSTTGFCQYVAKLGLPADIYSSVNGVTCITGATMSASNPSNTMLTEYPAWVASPTTVAHTINNLWIALCDTRAKPTIQFTDTDSVKFTEVAGFPAYNFSAETNFQALLIRKEGLSGTLTYANQGLFYIEPGYLQNPITNPAVPPRNAVRLESMQKQINTLGPTFTTVYDKFTSSPFDATSGNITVPSTGIYDLAFRVHMTAAPPTSTPAPNNTPATGGYGVGKGFWGGTPVSSNDSAATLATPTVTGGAGSGYTTGFAYLEVPGDDILVWITVDGTPDITGIKIINGGSGIPTSYVTGATALVITQPGSNNSGRVAVASLTKATPTCTIMAGLQTNSAGQPGVNHCVEVFNANAPMPFADLQGCANGIKLTAGDILEFRIGIITNDEDPVSAGQPNPIWEYTSAAEDYIEFYFRKVDSL